MPVYNTEKYLAEAIDSILAQSFADFELIVVDDGSRDGSAEIIRMYAERDARIRVIQHPENIGEAASRSAALAAAKGAYVTGQDSDDLCLPERLHEQVRHLQSNPQIGAVGVHAHVVSEDLQPIYDRRPPVRNSEIALNHFVGILGGAFVHASVMLRRRLLLEAGGYDESLRYCVDSDLMTRLLGRTRFANIPEPLYVYRRRQGQSGARNDPQRHHDMLLVRKRRFERLWGEAPIDSIDRLARIKSWSKLSWRERRAAKRDIIRVIDSMIAAGWVEAGERPHLINAMNRRLERASPRLWQMFCHWRRHHFGR